MKLKTIGDNVTKQKTNENTTKINQNNQNVVSRYNNREMKVTFSCTLPISIAREVESLVAVTGNTKSKVMQELLIKGLQNY